MRHGFIKTAAVTLEIKVADLEYNKNKIKDLMTETVQNGAKIVVFPELCISGYTCNDLFFQDLLLDGSRKVLSELIEHSQTLDALFFIGLPIEADGKIYNVSAAVSRGKLLGLVPKRFLPNYNEFYEKRFFTKGPVTPYQIHFLDQNVYFGSHILFECPSVDGLVVGCEICEDAWVSVTPSTEHAMAGATVLVNLSASDEVIGKEEYRSMLIRSLSSRLICAYLYSSAGVGESSQDLVFGGHTMIAEYGTMLKEGEVFKNQTIYGDIDIKRLRMERRKCNTFEQSVASDYVRIPFELVKEETILCRTFPTKPFVPADEGMRKKRCETILSMQANGLAKRLKHINGKKVVLGLSGGLDSTLALLVCVKAFEIIGLDPAGIITVTMPGFGTTGRTYDNACNMARCVNSTLLEVDIKEAVNVHFRDIGQNPEIHDITYENCQARERTQILMDIANKENAIVIGTGDMSELALGWATYNGDHMSMYGVNVGVPKTLVRHLVDFYARYSADEKLCAILLDVLDTPVSPELLPPKDGVIAQITEDVVGPYELHDFFLYYMLRCGYEPKKIYRIAVKTFDGIYDREMIQKWIRIFYRRFFSQQFKRSCMPDGVKIGSVALSPRGDLRMPSDASAALWLKELDELE
ncbi:MAG: NAD(+) synthase [Lachnospiraceae bacterium]|nr:NAD(+) synthase [Lachnospiraceae bacterium]